eukprot:3132292-Pleurochrysis_carterae.AAC.1
MASPLSDESKWCECCLPPVQCRSNLRVLERNPMLVRGCARRPLRFGWLLTMVRLLLEGLISRDHL